MLFLNQSREASSESWKEGYPNTGCCSRWSRKQNKTLHSKPQWSQTYQIWVNEHAKAWWQNTQNVKKNLMMSHCLPWSACIFQPNIWMKQGWREVGASFVPSSLRQLKLNELLNSSPYPNHSTLVKCLGRTSKSSVWKNAWQSGTHIYLGRLSAPSCTTALPFSLISVTERERERDHQNYVDCSQTSSCVWWSDHCFVFPPTKLPVKKCPIYGNWSYSCWLISILKDCNLYIIL